MTISMNQNMTNAEKALQLLTSQDYTCVVCKNEMTYTAVLRGVAPLVRWIKTETDLRGFSAADKVVGRATAFLYSILGVKEVYAHVMSEGALEVLEQAGITAAYGKLVKHIINRKGDGICPFEEAVLEIQNQEEAYDAILKKMELMGITV